MCSLFMQYVMTLSSKPENQTPCVTLIFVTVSSARDSLRDSLTPKMLILDTIMVNDRKDKYV